MKSDKSKLFTGYRDDLDIPSEWEDTSYGNDAMPSYELGRLRVWIDHPDKTQSEFYSPEMETFEDGGIEYTRFLVVDVSVGDGDPDDHEPLLQTNDFKEVVLCMKKYSMKTYHVRVREDKVGYYSIKAKSLDDAEKKALYNLRGETEGEICPSVDFEEFNPKEFK